MGAPPALGADTAWHAHEKATDDHHREVKWPGDLTMIW